MNTQKLLAHGLLVATYWLTCQPSPFYATDLTLENLQQDIQQHVESCLAATVGVSNKKNSGQGSGVIIDASGIVMTAAHVVGQVGEQLDIILTDGNRAEGVVILSNSQADIAAIRITSPAPEGGWHARPLALNTPQNAGDWALAFGHASGIQVDRHAPLRVGRLLAAYGEDDVQFLVSDCTVVSGDSGGPLFNTDGQVIGIHSFITTQHISGNHHVSIDCIETLWGDYTSGIQPWPSAEQTGNNRSLALYEIFLDPNRLADDTNPYLPSEVYPAIPAEVLPLLEQALRDNFPAASDALIAQTLECISFDIATGLLNIDITSEAHAMALEEAQFIDNGPDVEAGVRALNFVAITRRFGDSNRAVWRANPIENTVVFELLNDQNQQIACATPMTEGWLLSKASELTLHAQYTLKWENNIALATVHAIDETTDLALLYTQAAVPETNWATEQISLGDLLVNPATEGVFLSTASVSPQEITEHMRGIGNGNRVILGIRNPPAVGKGALVESVFPGTPAEEAGIQTDDRILQVGDDIVESAQHLTELIGEYFPGDTVDIVILRNGEEITQSITFVSPNGTRVFELPATASAAQEVSSMTGTLSERRRRFPKAITHDAPLWANDMGGALYNLEGQAVGINIARFDRTATYALTPDIIQAQYSVLLTQARTSLEAQITDVQHALEELDRMLSELQTQQRP